MNINLKQKLTAFEAVAAYSSKREKSKRVDLEALVGFSVSDEYWEFLIEYPNGLTFEKDVGYRPITPYPWSKRPLHGIFDFYGLRAHSKSVVAMFDTYDGRMPIGIIPIGEAGGGNQICLSLRKEDFNSIYFWDHEGEVDKKMNPILDGSNLYLTAKSFNDFLLSFEPDEGDDDIGDVEVTLRI